MSEKQGVWEQMLAKRAEWAASQPSLSAELKAIGREAIKDVRGTLHESYFGKPEHASELGTPLNPTPQMTTQELGTVHGSYQQTLDSYTVKGQEQQQQTSQAAEAAPQESYARTLSAYAATAQEQQHNRENQR
jgi:hypothetical protein